MERYISTCYPEFKQLCHAVELLPLSARSLLIKLCQAQSYSYPDDDSPLSNLISQHPPVLVKQSGTIKEVSLHSVFHIAEVNPVDPLDSAIILDILRSSDLDDIVVEDARAKGWVTEMKLAVTKVIPECNFFPFLFPQSFHDPIHESLPIRPDLCARIHRRFENFRKSIEGSWFYPRATHKNMSRDTRRDFEHHFESNLEDFPIFGQDDWQRVYHETGYKVGGSCELRQKWYTHGIKPRTYVAMGGLSYGACRFLQDFFTDLVNAFPATNHITRLQPNRLLLSWDDPDHHYRIYDLSSFTSNCKEQKKFISALKEFFRGCKVIIVDECVGPLEVDLGDLLDEYEEYCILEPDVSFERSFRNEYGVTDPVGHARASMLGIFGNLMTCTLAHYLLVAPCVEGDLEINIAGDDGLVLETLLNRYFLDSAIGLVGDCAPEKTMRSDDTSAVCLKRPIDEERPTLHLGYNLIPPNIATTVSQLLGRPCNSRFDFYGLEDMSVTDRLDVLGKDLLRFLEACFKAGIDEYRANTIVSGFKRLASSILRFTPISGPLSALGYVWPLSPFDYNYYTISPLTVYAWLFCTSLNFHVRRVERIECSELKYSGDECSGNSDRRLILLERLGYLEKVPYLETLTGYESCSRWLSLQRKSLFDPVLYKYVCIKDIPLSLVFEE